MDNLSLFKSISIKNDKKIVFLVIDGLGGIPHFRYNKTELELSYHPNLDKIAKESLCGLAIPVELGVTPGSGPGHVALFGYDPIKYLIGRGILEVLGLGMDITNKDLAFRGNFATISEGVITDRRAGRIPTEETQRLVEKIKKNISKIDDVEIFIMPGKEHRFAGFFRHDNLKEEITDNDPHIEGQKPKKILPLKEDKDTIFTSYIVEKFITEVSKILKDEKKANYVLLRGFSKYPNIPKLSEIYKLTPLAIAVYPMYKGLAKIFGMEVVDGCNDIKDEILKFKQLYNSEYDFFYIHIKDTDKLGEDGNFEEKVKKIEYIDKFVGEIYSVKPDVLVVTADHSTPSVLKGHSWHLVPVAIWSKNVPIKKNVFSRFTEIEFSKGITLYSNKILPLAMAYAGKLDKYGA